MGRSQRKGTSGSSDPKRKGVKRGATPQQQSPVTTPKQKRGKPSAEVTENNNNASVRAETPISIQQSGAKGKISELGQKTLKSVVRKVTPNQFDSTQQSQEILLSVHAHDDNASDVVEPVVANNQEANKEVPDDFVNNRWGDQTPSDEVDLLLDYNDNLEQPQFESSDEEMGEVQDDQDDSDRDHRRVRSRQDNLDASGMTKRSLPENEIFFNFKRKPIHGLQTDKNCQELSAISGHAENETAVVVTSLQPPEVNIEEHVNKLVQQKLEMELKRHDLIQGTGKGLNKSSVIMVAKDKRSKPVNTPNVVVKSPSDTTIYVPALKLLSPKPPSSNSHELP